MINTHETDIWWLILPLTQCLPSGPLATTSCYPRVVQFMKCVESEVGYMQVSLWKRLLLPSCLWPTTFFFTTETLIVTGDKAVWNRCVFHHSSWPSVASWPAFGHWNMCSCPEVLPTWRDSPFFIPPLSHCLEWRNGGWSWCCHLGQ